MPIHPAFFEAIRRVYDEASETWWFSGGGYHSSAYSATRPPNGS